ncbi:relaxase/mobilization nuclease domain-containing protein [Tenacibaculum sp. TC6]|uniref:relaxase/mobilization nuclease domain-containing protein n=1 Tax=Tenacibaculum sp. TC6 TaxID=3423223 RepID=UPI003D36D3BD
MLIRSIPHKTTPIPIMFEYAESDKGFNDENTLRVFHNLDSIEIEDIQTQYIQNFSQKKKRKNSVKFYHELISFSPLDSEYLLENEHVLQQIFQTYLEKRCPLALGYAVLHKSEAHLHGHFIISSLNIDGTNLRLSQQEFKNIKLEMEEYQKEFPEIKHSFCEHGSRSKSKTKLPSFQTRKLELIQTVSDIYEKSLNKTDFLERLSELEGVELYKNGIIKDGQKYRYNTLNISSEKMQVLEQLEKLKKLREKEKDIDKPFNPTL